MTPNNPQPSPQSSFSDRFRAWRNRTIAKPAFQKWSMKLPFIRRIAKGKANDLFELTAGFVYSQILFSCVQLDLFKVLNEAPQKSSELASRFAMEPPRLETLLRAAESLDLISRDGNELWWLDDLGVVLANDEGIIAMIKHHDMLYRDLADPLTLLNNRGPDAEIAKFWAYPHHNHADINDKDAFAYSELMRVSQSTCADQVLQCYDFAKHTSLVDVGGGHGAFLSAIGSAHPHLQLGLFDLPQVADKGRELLNDAGFGERLQSHGGSFFEDNVPRGSDCYSLIRVLYDHDDHRVIEILTNIFNAMDDNATLIIAEPMDGEGRAESLIGAYFSYYLLAMGSGKCRTADEISSMLQQVGFTRRQKLKTKQPLFASMVTAQK